MFRCSIITAIGLMLIIFAIPNPGHLAYAGASTARTHGIRALTRFAAPIAPVQAREIDNLAYTPSWPLPRSRIYRRQADLHFLSAFKSVTTGEPITIRWAGARKGDWVKIVLKSGPTNDLRTVSTIAESSDGWKLEWIPPMDLTPRDDYALEIRQGTVVNYSNRFAVLPGRGHPPVKVTAKLANPSRILPPRLTSRSTPPTTIHHTSTHATSTTTNKPNRPSIASKPYPTPHFTTCPAPLNALFIIPSPLKAHPAIRFAVRCNVDYPGNDIRALHASNLQACMHWCAEEKDCKGVSFLHDRVQGKKQHKYKSEIRQRGNCWLKRSVEGNGKGSDWGVDSAKVL